ncbi:MAG: hypothetical protein JXI43_04580 [Tissierellales bacterium]|nr:hypothetical protein [Tissierellales bacterium]
MTSIVTANVKLDIPKSVPLDEHMLKNLMTKVQEQALADLDSRYGESWCSDVYPMAAKKERYIWFRLTVHRADLVKEIMNTFDKHWEILMKDYRKTNKSKWWQIWK